MSKDGGSAFPLSRPDWFEDGMTLRDWFAGQSIAGLNPGKFIDNGAITKYAQSAYRLADAMLAEREKEAK